MSRRIEVSLFWPATVLCPLTLQCILGLCMSKTLEILIPSLLAYQRKNFCHTTVLTRVNWAAAVVRKAMSIYQEKYLGV